MVKVLSIDTKLTPAGEYRVAIETDDGNTVALVPHSLVSDMRSEYEKEHLQATRLDDRAIVSIAATFNDDVKANDPELLAEMVKIDPPQAAPSIKSVSATERDTIALKVSKLLSSNVAACNAIKEWMALGEKRKTLPAYIPYLLKQTFPKEVRAEMPIPGSIRPEKNAGNRLYDRADSNPGTESWYVGAVEDVPGYWEEIGIPLRKLTEVTAKDSTVQNEYTAKGIQRNTDLKKLLQQRKKDMVAAFRDGIEVLNIIDTVEETIPGMNVFFRVTDGVIDRTLSPLRLVYEDESKPKGDDLRYREKFLSVGALRRVDLTAVMQANDKFEAFKPVRSAVDDEEEGLTSLKSANDLERIVGWLAINERNGELKTAFKRRVNAPPSESDSLLLLLAGAKAFVDDLLDSPKVRSRINALLEKQVIEPDRKVA